MLKIDANSEKYAAVLTNGDKISRMKYKFFQACASVSSIRKYV